MLWLLALSVLLSTARGALLYASLGDNVTLPCYYDAIVSNVCWYRQVPWEQPQILFTFYKHGAKPSSPDGHFRDKRFSLHPGERFCHLNISGVQPSDSALYFCGQATVGKTVIKEGTLLALRDSSRMSFLQQPDSLSVSPGGSATLRCTVVPGTKDLDHSVYWFRGESAPPHSGTLYVHSRGGSRCVQSVGSAARSCAFSLFNVSRSDSGMYYCAVASCGEIVFGKGTRLEVGGNQTSPVPLYGITAALLVSVTFNIILFGLVCHRRRKALRTEGSSLQQRAPEYTADVHNEESGSVQYVALDLKKGRGASRRLRGAEEDTVYSGVRPSDRD